MLNKLLPSSLALALICDILVALTAFSLASFIVLDFSAEVWITAGRGMPKIFVPALTMVTGLYLQDLYSNLRVQSRFLLFQQCCLAAGLAFLLQAVLSYGSPLMVLPRWVMMIGSVITIGLLVPWRWLYGEAVAGGRAAERILFVGANPTNLAIVEHLERRPELGRTAIGFLVEESGDETGRASELGLVEDFRAAVEQHKPDRVVVGMKERRNRMPVEALVDVNFSGTPVEDAEALFETVSGRISTRQLRPSHLIFSTELGPRGWVLKLQALYSWLIAAIGLIIAAPIMLIVGILVKLTSPGPVFYSQKRVGQFGRVFWVHKFRSMRADAEAKTGAVWATRGDPRITRFGRFLRKSRLDELPQLWNVLKGEMSVVGPRPERPEFVSVLSEQLPFYRQRHCVRPGITGWAQINHKYGDTMEDTVAKLEYDLYYIKHLSVSLDSYIMFQTVKVMLLSRGAQ